MLAYLGRGRRRPGRMCFSSSHRVYRLLPVLAVAAALGCAPGVHWAGYSYPHVQAKSRETGQLMLVFLKNWYSVECTQFEENVLKTEALREATADMLCAMISYDFDQDLAKRWDVPEAPAIVIVDSEGGVLARRWGKMTAADVLRSIEQSKTIAGPTSALPDSP